jgi:hypothetical protein
MYQGTTLVVPNVEIGNLGFAKARFFRNLLAARLCTPSKPKLGLLGTPLKPCPDTKKTYAMGPPLGIQNGIFAQAHLISTSESRS